MRIIKYGLVVLVVAALGGAGYLYVQLRSIAVERLSDDLYVLRGLGGNAAVLKTSAGSVVVDTMTFPLQGGRIRDLATELTGMAPMMVINTHYHLDHTHGNPAFAPGTRVLSTQRTLSHLHALDADSWTDEAAQLLPNETFSDRRRIEIGGKTLDLMAPGRGHTDGDLVVVFVNERVIHMGDLLFHRHYPNIDLEAGGSVREWPDTLERVFDLEFDRVIPGHGETTDRAGVRQFQTFLAQLADIGTNAAAQEISLEATQQTTQLTADRGYTPIQLVVVNLDRRFVLRRAWEEATGNFERLN